MRILAIRMEDGGGGTVARFDAELTPEIKMFNLKLVRSRCGSLRVYAPNAYGSNVAAFSPKFASDLIAAASSFLGEKTDHANRAVG